MAARAEIVRAVLRTAVERDWPVFVGNGLLAREIMSIAPPGASPVLPLQGGMGLAGGVAAGVLLGDRCEGAMVLEGDGNHLMGFGAAQLIGHLGLPVVHVVSCNGTYRSTGGQRVPFSASQERCSAAAITLGYHEGRHVTTLEALQDALGTATTVNAPTLIYVSEDASSDVPPRLDRTTAEFAAQLAEWLARAHASG